MIRGPRPFHKPTKTCTWVNTCSSRYYNIANIKKSVTSNIQTVTKHTLKMRKSVSSSIQTLTSDTLNTGERVLSNFQTMTRTTLNTRKRVYPTFNPDDWYIRQFPISKLSLKYSNPLLFLWVSLKRVLAVGNTHLSFPAHVQLGWECCRHHYSAWTPQCRQDETQQRRIHQLWHEQGIKSNKHGQGFLRKILRSTQRGTAVSSEEIKRG